MNITKSASILDWRTNTQGRWTAVVDDIAPSTQDISFGNGYTATVTNRKITVENPIRPSGTVTYAVEEIENTAYADNLAAVGSVKDTLDVVTGERSVKFGVLHVTDSMNFTTYSNSNYRGFVVNGVLPVAMSRVGYICSSNVISSRPAGGANVSNPGLWVGVNTSKQLYVVWTTSSTGIPADWYDSQSDTLNLTGFMDWLHDNPFDVTYVMPTATDSELVPQPLSFAQGSNNIAAENAATDLATPYSATYTGTDYAIRAVSNHKYLKRIDGEDSVVTGVTSIAVKGGRDLVMDLSWMWSFGQEPLSADQFYFYFPQWRGYQVPYNPGSIVNYKGTGLRTVGFNLLDTGGRTAGTLQNTSGANTAVRGPFDETKYYVGLAYSNSYKASEVSGYTITSASVTVTCKSRFYGVAFPIRCVPGQTYRSENRNGSDVRLAYYTYNGTLISYSEDQASAAPANAYWCLICYAPTANNSTATWTNPCVHLQWSGPRNGDYEQYWSSVISIPSLTYFPTGMNGRGTVSDELNATQYIRRFNVVDLGTFTWTPYASGYLRNFKATPATAKPKNTPWTTDIANCACAQYQADKTAYAITQPAQNPQRADGRPMYDKRIAINGQEIVVLDYDYNTATAAQFKEAMSGVYLIYELATPVYTNYSIPPNFNTKVSDFGTEESLPVDGYEITTAPIKATVRYQDDYARTITKLPENYQSQESMDNLLALLGQLHNGIISTTFDAASQSYKYNFTPNA